MPIYDYKCPSCGYTLTAIRTVEERDRKTRCFDCDVALVRTVNAPSRVWAPTRSGQ